MEYFNGYLRGPFASFCARRGWEQRDGGRGDAAAFAAIPHHPSYVAPGDRMHHMRQVQVSDRVVCVWCLRLVDECVCV